MRIKGAFFIQEQTVFPTERASAGCLWAAPAVLRFSPAQSLDWRASLSSPCAGPPAWGRPSPQAWQRSRRNLSAFRLNSKWWVFKRILHWIVVVGLDVSTKIFGELLKFPINSKKWLILLIIYYLFRSGCTVGHRSQIQGSLCPLSVTPSRSSEGRRILRGELRLWTHANGCGFAQGPDPWLQTAGQFEDLQTRWEKRLKDLIK